MRSPAFRAAPFAAAVLIALAAPARAGVVDAATLATIPTNAENHTYTGFDGVGTSLTVEQTAGASMNPIIGTWTGLWLGSAQESDTYTFTFDRAVSYIELYITAQSTLAGSYSEVFTDFVTNAATTATFANESGISWDGSTLSSSVNDGRSRIRFTSNGTAGFTSLSFAHVQTGGPNGSVVQEVLYGVAAVPEPSTYALMFAGLACMGLIAARRRPD